MARQSSGGSTWIHLEFLKSTSPEGFFVLEDPGLEESCDPNLKLINTVLLLHRCLDLEKSSLSPHRSFRRTVCSLIFPDSAHKQNAPSKSPIETNM